MVADRTCSFERPRERRGHRGQAVVLRTSPSQLVHAGRSQMTDPDCHTPGPNHPLDHELSTRREGFTCMRTITGAEDEVFRILNPRSVAVIGASARPGSLSWWPTHLLRHRGFAGDIFPINPKYTEIEGVTCYPSLDALPSVPDLAIITLSADASIDAVEQCGAAGVRSVVMPSQGFGELGHEGRIKERRLLDIAARAGIRIVGPNTDGIANIASGAVVSIQPLFQEQIDAGPVAVVAQSGATAASLIMRLQAANIGVCMSASAGNEIDLGLADYMSVMLQDPQVSMLVSFVEAVRHPEHFYKVAELAAELA